MTEPAERTDPTRPRHPLDERRLAALPVDAGLAALRDDIVATGTRRERARRWPLVVAAAASVAAVAAIPAYLAQRDPDAGPATPATTSAPTPTPTSTPPPTPARTPEGVPSDGVIDAPAPIGVEQRAWTGPSRYVLLESPGWTVERDSVAGGSGQGVTYVQGGQRLGLTWSPQRWYAGQVADAATEPTASTIEVLGERATYVEYESEQQMAYLPVRDGFGLRVDGAFTTPATFRAVLGDLRVVDAAGFAAGLPPAVVTPAESGDVAHAMLADVEAAPGTVVRAPGGYNARYHVAAAVVIDVGCAWLRQWVDGDAAARREAERALAGSRRWAAVTDDLRQPGWFAETVRLMRTGASADTVFGSAQCGAAPTPAGAPEPTPDDLAGGL